jgi:hypothetical protein
MKFVPIDHPCLAKTIPLQRSCCCSAYGASNGSLSLCIADYIPFTLCKLRLSHPHQRHPYLVGK